MQRRYDHQAVLDDWKSFNNGSLTNLNHVRNEVLESWLRCRENGSSSSAPLPEPQYNQAIEIYKKDWIYGQGLTMPHITNFLQAAE